MSFSAVTPHRLGALHAGQARGVDRHQLGILRVATGFVALEAGLGGDLGPDFVAK
jgi:hypothetical protein